MKINKNSSVYIVVYATVMVVIVALVLAFASLSLQPLQKANQINETKGAILLSIGEGQDADNVKDKTAYINEEYDKYIKESYVIDMQGNVVDGDAFSLVSNLKAAYDAPADQRVLPVFKSESADGAVRYVLPLYGAGLWGPVWGYLALESDWTTIYGAVFDHKSETPGLGAEIATPAFQSQFKGKSIFRGSDIVGITVTKGVGSSAGNSNAVDAISGGTITSRAVQDMIGKGLADYAPFIAKQKAGGVDMSSAARLEEEASESALTGDSTPEQAVTDNQPLTIENNE